MKHCLIIIALLLAIPFNVAADLTKEERAAVIKLLSYKKPSDRITIGNYRDGTAKWAVFMHGCKCAEKIEWHGIGDDLPKIVDEGIAVFEKIKCD